MRVRAGSSYKEEGGSVRKISTAIIHPRYKDYDYDIGVIKVTRPFRFGESIKPIVMISTPPEVDTCAIVSGWGDLREGGNSPSRLQHVEVLIVDFYRCVSSYKRITSRMICAGWPKGGKDACQMDSGGPLVSEDKLIGIVSWGYGCAQKGYPGVYTSVSVLRNWVISHVGD
ncbi:vitellin-degrading protease-like [Periplaneta americana]|uniref:vitellin-degrading protease-like n=1 Tax=Periplaneta americana TaxID=6978 RepID=UPI0037E8AC00